MSEPQVSEPRRLIVNADDFGQSPGVNRGVVQAHEHGIVTSASLMVRWPAAAEAAAYARTRPELSVGLHLDLGEWEYVDGTWRAHYQVVDPEDRTAVAEEVTRQLNAFRQLMGRRPTHLDSHQHVHRYDPVRTRLRRAGDRLGIPVRSFTPRARYSGEFYGQDGRGAPMPHAITTDALLGLLERLPPGVTELGCHPGYGDDLTTMYREERAREVESLCDPAVRAAVTGLGIELCSFADLGGAMPADD